MSEPALIEPGAKYFFRETLKNCRIMKNNYSSLVFNVVAFIGLSVALVLFLRYKKGNKLTFAETQKRELAKQIYLVEKLKMADVAQRQDEMITNLPKY